MDKEGKDDVGIDLRSKSVYINSPIGELLDPIEIYHHFIFAMTSFQNSRFFC